MVADLTAAALMVALTTAALTATDSEMTVTALMV